MAKDHSCWSNEDHARKVHKKRFGNVLRSKVAGLSPMMREHTEEVQGWIMGIVERHEADSTEDEKAAAP